MNCPPVHQIYLFLEHEMHPSEALRFEKHLFQCPGCREAVAERRILLQAYESLPPLQPPPDFTNMVMSRIFPQKISWKKNLLTATAGSSVIFIALLFVFLRSGQNLFDFLVSLNQSTLNMTKNITVLGAKFIKITSLIVSIIYQFAGFLLSGLIRLTTILSIESQIIGSLITLILTCILLYSVKKRFLVGEK